MKQETSSRSLFFEKKASYVVKNKWSEANFQYLWIALNLAYNKNKLSKTCSRNMLNFDFLEKGLRIVSPPYFMQDFWRKIFLMLYYINCPNFIFWLLLLLEILVNMCIAIVCYSGRDVIKFEINFIFLIKSFFYVTKKSRQKFKYLENKKEFSCGKKNIIFKGLSIAFKKLKVGLSFNQLVVIYLRF